MGLSKASRARLNPVMANSLAKCNGNGFFISLLNSEFALNFDESILYFVDYNEILCSSSLSARFNFVNTT